MDLLPGDVLADVLGRLAPRSLAACRSVCKAWCAVVDAHRLLRADLLPLSLAGIYVVYHTVWPSTAPPTFFSRPSAGSRIQGDLGYLNAVRPDWSRIGVHCNGLFLLHEGMVNPATGQWACLPAYPDRTRIKGFAQHGFLAFDPTVSSHFEVFFMHCVLHRSASHTELSPNSEWPPSPYIMSALPHSHRRHGGGRRGLLSEKERLYGPSQVYSPFCQTCTIMMLCIGGDGSTCANCILS
jgi:hypothetical protein